ncbi:sensor histidine kinase [Paenibacillus sp. FSL E2-8871]|uniref:Sensor histidine kinase n=2 Tax=Paenibacillus TaxID=44249 RepID=A0A1R0ZEY8_9BACL|nr:MULTISPECIES: sensor histidine kinase [Paenibacillus]AIQ26003.1 histidine kinase [Paenibacillus sp. FSL H7-0737]KAA1187839.1 sensor histidine kinase [Paenibacillus sp. B2(2019)]OMD48273.1 sensor histidine kinase [Paenibacillus odorifer]OME68497.1 sensor histidine kinase [Paenibacillus odorifer]
MDKKNKNMMSRSMGEGALFSFVMLLVILYTMYTYGYLKPFESWMIGLRTAFTLILLPMGFGVGFGFYQSFRVKRKLERLRETLVLWEKGNLTLSMPDLGDDELGRLGEQLGRISGKWENQVTTLQRLSTNNAKLAEQARVSAIMEERQRLARELHDAVSQQLFAISMTATAVGRTLEKDFDKAQRQIALIEEMSAVAQSEMRALLLHLRPVYLEGKGLEQGLQELIKELKVKVPIEIVFEMDPDVQLLKGVENHLFRIVQEAISNTLRHAKAEKMEIRLHRRGDTVRLTLRDDGIGFELDDSKQTSYGLSNMQERMNEIGGSIQFITAPGKGMRIEITVPLVNE